MPSKDECISIWLGRFDSQAEFKKYIKVHYEKDDEEDISSEFEKDFNIKYYDRNKVEVGYFDDYTNTLSELFRGSSYLDEYVETLNSHRKLEYNVIVRIYDFKYTGEKRISHFNKNDLIFYENLKYKKDVDLSWMGL